MIFSKLDHFIFTNVLNVVELSYEGPTEIKTENSGKSAKTSSKKQTGKRTYIVDSKMNDIYENTGFGITKGNKLLLLITFDCLDFLGIGKMYTISKDFNAATCFSPNFILCSYYSGTWSDSISAMRRKSKETISFGADFRSIQFPVHCIINPFWNGAVFCLYISSKYIVQTKLYGFVTFERVAIHTRIKYSKSIRIGQHLSMQGVCQ